MIKKIFFIGIILSTLAGCKKDFLDTKPENAISSANIWSNDINATMGIAGMYSNFSGQNNDGAYMRSTFDYSYWGPDGYNYNDKGSLSDAGTTSSNGDMHRAYVHNYQIIGRANDAIFHLTNNPNVTPALRDRFIGEAEFIRGFCYFNLWALFGGVILLDHPINPADSYLARNTSDETVQFIIKDFTDAISRLPVTYSAAADRGRATKGAAQAMLGKTYLYNQEWAQAAVELEKLQNPPYTYALVSNFADLFNFATERNSEVIFDVEAISYPGLGSYNDFEYGGRSLNSSGWSECSVSWSTILSYTNQDGSAIDISDMPRSSNYASEYLYGLDLIPWYQNKYKNADKRLAATAIMPGSLVVGNNNVTYMVNWPFGDHANDAPYPAYQLDDNSKASIPWRKYIDVGNTNPVFRESPTNIVLIRYADVLLMWAEAKNEATEPSQDIFDAVNMIRDRGGVPHISGLSQADLRLAIRMERFRELAGEGQLFFDVRRWKTAAGTDPIFGENKEIDDFRGERLWTKVFEDRYYLWGIPNHDILLDPNLVQNPGWAQ